MTEAKTDTKTKAVKQRRGKVPRAVAETATKEAILHLRLERADHDALEALVLSTGLDRGALARLVIRAGLRVAENDPRDLLAPKANRGPTPNRGPTAATGARGASTDGATATPRASANRGPTAATGVVAGSGIRVSPIRAAGHVEDEDDDISPVLHTADDAQVSVATTVANDTSKPRTKPTKG